MNETDYTKIEKARLREMVSELYPLREKFNDWEYRFISNLKDWTGDFKPRQKFNIVRVYNKYFSGENFGK